MRISLVIAMIVAGICFASWPLSLNRSGLSGTDSALIYTASVLLCLLPVSLQNGITLAGVDWKFVVIAAIIGAVGLTQFNGGLAKATPQEVSSLILIMVVTQITVLAGYHIFMNGGLALKKAVGLAAAVLAAFLLL